MYLSNADHKKIGTTYTMTQFCYRYHRKSVFEKYILYTSNFNKNGVNLKEILINDKL